MLNERSVVETILRLELPITKSKTERKEYFRDRYQGEVDPYTSLSDMIVVFSRRRGWQEQSSVIANRQITDELLGRLSLFGDFGRLRQRVTRDFWETWKGQLNTEEM